MTALEAVMLCGVTSAFIFYLVLRPAAASPLERIAALDAAAVPVERLGRWLEVRTVVHQRVGRRIDSSDRGRSLQQKLLRSGLALWPIEWIALTVAVAGGAGALAWLRFGAAAAGVAGVAAGGVALQATLALLVRRRDRAFDRQLGPSLLALANAVRAGHTFAQALSTAAESAHEPMRQELMRAVHEVQLGIPLNVALQRLAERNRSVDLRFIVLAVQVHAQVGGNLAEILSSSERLIRERLRIRGDIATLTAQARVSGWILIALPFALAGILTMIAPGYFGPMLSQPLGNVMLGFSVFAMACGYGIIRRIVNVRI